jgi:hypothetical protein
MADGISWKDFEQHFDNIIPGTILCAEFTMIFSSLPKSLNLPTGFAKGAGFVAISYALGLVSALTSRIILDSISEKGLRAWVFMQYVHGDRRKLARAFVKDPQLGHDFRSEKRLRQFKHVAFWNVIYRASLRAGKSAEVDRRRVQGRITRNLFFPAVICGWLLARPICVESQIVIALCAGAFLCCLYSYAELSTMAEASDISLRIAGNAN